MDRPERCPAEVAVRRPRDEAASRRARPNVADYGIGDFVVRRAPSGTSRRIVPSPLLSTKT